MIKKIKQIKATKNLIFVVQKHDATRLHYDLRLEINDVLKSWAIPKRPSKDPEEVRLAIETTDHPMSYATFEGIIPEGRYGAGTVEIWDEGYFKNIRKKNGRAVSLVRSYKEGKIEVSFDGKKLRGKYALIRMEGFIKKWFFLKMRDEAASKKKSKNEN